MAAITNVRIVLPDRKIKGFSYFMAWHCRLTAESAQALSREQLRMTARNI
jgi:hypothetical protein